MQEQIKRHFISRANLIFISTLIASFLYSFHYFNFFETPSEDFLGNFRPMIVQFLSGIFPGIYFKILPLYPILLALMTKIFAFRVNDPIYRSALILNMTLLVPYLFLVYHVYRKFTSEKISQFALLFLCVNIYTVFTAVNSELEMLLSLLVVLTVYLILYRSQFSYITACLASLTKWDSIFLIPAAGFIDFFIERKRIKVMIMCLLSVSGIVVWFFFSYLNPSNQGNVYIKEIAARGPNIYRYIIDCFLIPSSLLSWLGMEIYYSGSFTFQAILFPVLLALGAVILTAIPLGAVRIIRQNKKIITPLIVFFSGFLLIHMIYQNTKERYVLPILWLLVLFLVTGFIQIILPAIRSFINNLGLNRKRILGIFFWITLPLFILTSIPLLLHERYSLILYSFIFLILFTLLCLDKPETRKIMSLIPVIALAGCLINGMIYFGTKTMDHYSYRRVEFKKAGIWFKENYKKNDIMLITESSIPVYFSGLKENSFFPTSSLKSSSVDELIQEMKTAGITHVFIDDFYIRRLKVMDRNAIDRKAGLMKELLDKAEHIKEMRKLASFETKGNIKSYLYRFNP